jgi:hypothetical protein
VSQPIFLREPVAPMMVTPICHCGEKLRPRRNGGLYTSNPPKQDYDCANGHSAILEAGYPKIEWEVQK